jgi:hypothetical protein
MGKDDFPIAFFVWKITKGTSQKDKYDNAGVYKLKSKECEQYHIGGTDRNSKTR